MVNLLWNFNEISVSFLCVLPFQLQLSLKLLYGISIGKWGKYKEIVHKKKDLTQTHTHTKTHGHRENTTMGNSKTKPEQSNSKEPTNENENPSDPQLQIRNCIRNVRGVNGSFSDMYPNEAGASCGSYLNKKCF